VCVVFCSISYRYPLQQVLLCDAVVRGLCFFILPVVAITYKFFADDYRGPRRACILYWVLQLAVGVVKSFSVLRCSWINNFILAFASSMFSFCFETWLVLEHEKVCVFF
jgi:hypothetical protein